jgi:exocyst complex component 8
VKWAKEQVDAFNDFFIRQLSSVDSGGPVWTHCMNQAREHALMLSEVGLDFKDLVGRQTNAVESKGLHQGLGLSQ